MRLVIDLDGTICEIRKPEESYAGVKPKPGAAEAIRSLRKDGHYVIIHTSRHMKTCNHNQGLVLAKIGKVTLDWLEKHGVEYDEIIFGKPLGDLYIEDLALPFKSWQETVKKVRAMGK